MEFNIIDAERMNVYLTRADMERENISLNVLYSSEKELRQQLTKIFKKAAEEAGFGVENIPLEVEIIPIIDGDLFISIHKVSKGSEEIYMQGIQYHFVFQEIENLIELCHEISSVFTGDSDLYLYNCQYHLLLYPRRMTQARLKQVHNCLREFGDDCTQKNMASITEGVLGEYGKKICSGNCIDLFTKIFKIC